MDFQSWIASLNRAAAARHYAEVPLTDTTGTECWRGYYEEGMTPARALEADARAGGH